jgi:hypothetical protein
MKFVILGCYPDDTHVIKRWIGEMDWGLKPVAPKKCRIITNSFGKLPMTKTNKTLAHKGSVGT